LGWVTTADVFVLNSTYEGLSHALIETMSLGTPIIATAIGGNPELITNEVDGLLIPPNNDEALHAALLRVEKDPMAAKARAVSAKQKTSTFSIDTTITQLAELLHTI
jgi:glycosyltransferase involved in cell wall biosynthesis